MLSVPTRCASIPQLQASLEPSHSTGIRLGQGWRGAKISQLTSGACHTKLVPNVICPKFWTVPSENQRVSKSSGSFFMSPVLPCQKLQKGLARALLLLIANHSRKMASNR